VGGIGKDVEIVETESRGTGSKGTVLALPERSGGPTGKAREPSPQLRLQIALSNYQSSGKINDHKQQALFIFFIELQEFAGKCRTILHKLLIANCFSIIHFYTSS